MTTSVVNQLSTGDVLHAYGEGLEAGRRGLADEIQRRGAYTLYGGSDGRTDDPHSFTFVIAYADGSTSVATIKGVSDVFQQVEDGLFDGEVPVVFINDPEAAEPLLRINLKFVYSTFVEERGLQASFYELYGEPTGIPHTYATITTYSN